MEIIVQRLSQAFSLWEHRVQKIYPWLLLLLKWSFSLTTIKKHHSATFAVTRAFRFVIQNVVIDVKVYKYFIRGFVMEVLIRGGCVNFMNFGCLLTWKDSSLRMLRISASVQCRYITVSWKKNTFSSEDRSSFLIVYIMKKRKLFSDLYGYTTSI